LSETALKNDSFTCELIESGRAGQLVPVTAQICVVILADEPKDIWPFTPLFGRVRECDRQNEGSDDR
jgi:hypothetical protein